MFEHYLFWAFKNDNDNKTTVVINRCGNELLVMNMFASIHKENVIVGSNLKMKIFVINWIFYGKIIACI